MGSAIRVIKVFVNEQDLNIISSFRMFFKRHNNDVGGQIQRDRLVLKISFKDTFMAVGLTSG
ncbi:MAG: hypothetical protein CMK28_01330 [Porticoccaceae bacterium]|nr:hypothetical protein [Porticoccaceae bacterium]|tara:strand:+ start:40 stop:225 length:186 start_codon:yes stop_codon:yes gene_type:complete